MRVFGYEIVDGEQYDELDESVINLRRELETSNTRNFDKNDKILELQKANDELGKEIDVQLNYTRELEGSLAELKELPKPKKVVKRKTRSKKPTK